MRVLHISSLYPPDQVGGAELMLSALAETQAALGHEVAVACLSRDQKPPTARNGVIVYRMGYGTPFFILDWPQRSRFERLAYNISAKANGYAVDGVTAAIRAFKPDIVNTHSLSELPPQIWPAAKTLGLSIVHTLHDFKSVCTKGAMFVDGKACDVQHLRCRLLSYPHYRCQFSVDAVTAVGTDILRRHLDAKLFLHIPPHLRRVIWNPIEKVRQARKRSRVPGDDVVFGVLGRIEPSKGIDTLLQACRKLPAGGWKLMVAGRAVDGLERYRALAQGLPVHFVGFVERDDFFNKIDCLVAPSIWPEAFGRTVAEAYALGVPAIGSRIAGIAEQIGAEQGEFLFPPGDSNALAHALIRMIENPARLLQKTANMTSVAARTAPEAVTDSYLDLYRTLLGQSAHKREYEVG